MKSPRPTRAILDELLAVPLVTAARLISVSPPTLRRMIAAGKIAGRQVGNGTAQRSFVVSCDALKSWISGASGK